MSVIEKGYKELEVEVLPKLSALESGFIAQYNQQGSCFNQALTFLKVTTLTQVKEFKVWWQTVQEHQQGIMGMSDTRESGDDGELVRRGEKLVTQILLVVQDLVKSVPETEEAEEGECIIK